ncbi:DsbA family protein [Sulfuriflexus sp.]|uniref:DsbA family protein n=1 Tax=Sulfuriflexus sp. TaxID=2015443 RepID=UPI0028CE5955|nr:DsbA family protein [Sulfuriflexus sp.]MDT8404932.1 DsbA family protein [Sulfuriflexus sp.]
MKTILYYIHDPMCSWCRGFNATLASLITALPEGIEFRRLLGGLAPDTNEPMNEATREMVQASWRRIEESIPGVSFNFDFWKQCQPRRATYPACRAVLAARRQGRDEDMIKAVQVAYYQQARNPSDDSTLLELAGELGLDKEQFSTDLHSDEVDKALAAEIKLARAMFVESYPSLVLKEGGSEWHIPVDYHDYRTMLELIEARRSLPDAD